MCAETPNILTQPWWTEKLFGWEAVQITQAGRFVVHMLPDNDLRPHFVRSDCWCSPVEDENEFANRVLTHNTLDGREAYEEGRRRLH